MVQPVANQTPMSGTTSYRRAILQRQIDSYLHRGFMVVSQTDTTAQLRKPKQFSCLWAGLWFLLFGIGIVVYLIYYASKQDELVFIEVSESGQVNQQYNKFRVTAKTAPKLITIFIVLFVIVVCLIAILAINSDTTSILSIVC